MARVRTFLWDKIGVYCVAQKVCHNQSLWPYSFVVPYSVVLKGYIISPPLLLFFSCMYLLLSPTLLCVLPAGHILLSSACQSCTECASHPDTHRSPNLQCDVMWRCGAFGPVEMTLGGWSPHGGISALLRRGRA